MRCVKYATQRRIICVSMNDGCTLSICDVYSTTLEEKFTNDGTHASRGALEHVT
jgi:hypothetical protein